MATYTCVCGGPATWYLLEVSAESARISPKRFGKRWAACDTHLPDALGEFAADGLGQGVPIIARKVDRAAEEG